MIFCQIAVENIDGTNENFFVYFDLKTEFGQYIEAFQKMQRTGNNEVVSSSKYFSFFRATLYVFSKRLPSSMAVGARNASAPRLRLTGKPSSWQILGTLSLV